MPVRRTGLLLLLAAFALAACAGTEPRHGGSEPSFGLVTFNLYHDKADWPTRRALIIGELRTLHPDVIVLQEVLQHESLRNQAGDLAAALGYSAYFISVDPADRPRRYGNAILTRHPVQARDWTRLRPLDDSRTAGMVRIDINRHPLDVYATHLHHEDTTAGARKRAEQLADLLAFVERGAGDAPSLVAGDFNVAAGRPELAMLGAAGYDEAFTRLHPGDPRPTLNPHYFPRDARRIDHVYLQRDRLVPVEARMVLDREGAAGAWPSDHFGLYVRFAFAPSR
ncbi:MAG TPA: endonuclease/exonuclease/phosphatase family protein [Thermomonas sp.]|nr:endonuclease/exonuclease/phosphatase family protein [Thermomonas sp.]